jgi:uncharacterized protein (TIGR03084 family)
MLRASLRSYSRAVDEIEALTEQQAELSGLLSSIDDAGWHRPSRCEGWDVADVVLHLAQTNEMAIGSAQHRFVEVLAGLTDGIGLASSVDDGAALMVERQRGGSTAELRARWQQSADTLCAAFRNGDPHDRVDWVAGQLSVRTLTTTRLAETWIHTGDVAEALGVDLVPAERLRHVARLAWRTLPYAFARDGRELSGPVSFELLGPSGTTWAFTPDERPLTTIRGSGVELCLVAARRVEPGDTSLEGEGPDAAAVLELVRTYA